MGVGSIIALTIFGLLIVIVIAATIGVACEEALYKKRLKEKFHKKGEELNEYIVFLGTMSRKLPEYCENSLIKDHVKQYDEWLSNSDDNKIKILRIWLDKKLLLLQQTEERLNHMALIDCTMSRMAKLNLLYADKEELIDTSELLKIRHTTWYTMKKEEKAESREWFNSVAWKLLGEEIVHKVRESIEQLGFAGGEE